MQGNAGKVLLEVVLGDYSDSDNIDDEDLETYDGFVPDLIVIIIERTAGVWMNEYVLHSILY